MDLKVGKLDALIGYSVLDDETNHLQGLSKTPQKLSRTAPFAIIANGSNVNSGIARSYDLMAELLESRIVFRENNLTYPKKSYAMKSRTWAENSFALPYLRIFG